MILHTMLTSFPPIILNNYHVTPKILPQRVQNENRNYIFRQKQIFFRAKTLPNLEKTGLICVIGDY